MSEQPAVFLSQVDSERFSVSIARAPLVSADNLDAILEFCRSNNVAMLIARCLVADLGIAQHMERLGFSLMDTLIYYRSDLQPLQSINGIDNGSDLEVRPMAPGEEQQVREVAAAAFTGYCGHYHSDPRLDRVKCDEGYQSWAHNACVSHTAGDQVLVALRQGVIVGFVALSRTPDQGGEVRLIGIRPEVQGSGISRSLLLHSMQLCREQGLQHLLASTQLININAQKLWTGLGFKPLRAFYTFHKWFDHQ
ncbi:MAG: GNAT family N-acetyltransferase [Candidatus Alcyoniella australis]|nr:GNAT family N-acetyltransferase [Candidatus Alcyoniella australis]